MPEHEIIKQAAYRLLTVADEAGTLEELFFFFDELPNDCFETLKKEPMVVLRRSKFSNDCFETLGPALKDCFETLGPLPKDCFETLLKILKSFKDSRKEKDSFTTQSTKGNRTLIENQVGGEAGRQDVWHLDQLLEKVSLKKQQGLLEQEKSAVPFLSWIMYGIANPSIQDPIGLAVSKLCDQLGIQAGGAFDRLAFLPPEQLIQLIQMELAMRYPSNRDWRLVMKSIHRDRVLLLSDLLNLTFGEGEVVM